MLRPILSAVAIAAGLAAAAPAEASEALPPELQQALKTYRLRDRGLSLYVHELDRPEPVLAFNADVPRNPASVMKLLPTLVALEALGPAYTWKTEAYAAGPLRDGVLYGDLYLRGTGDPYLVVEHFWRFLRALRLTGLEEIRGDLVVDQSHFAPGDGRAADFDGRPYRAYNVQPRALLVNFQTVQLRFQPEPHARRLAIMADPLPAQFAIDNRVRLAAGPCRGGARRLAMQVAEHGARPRLVFRGDYPAACGGDEFYRVVADTGPYLHGVFTALWRELGGRFEGGAREGPVPAGAELLHSAASPPLADIIRVANKYSNNVMTRQILLTLGAERYGPPGTVEKGEAVIRAWLADSGLDFPELVIENGSGLSREERISARHLGALLQRAWASPYMPEFVSSLPIMAVDGTLRARGGALAGRAHLKTGSLNDVRAKAGIVVDARGRRMAVAILHNDVSADTAAGEAFQQAVLSWVDSRP